MAQQQYDERLTVLTDKTVQKVLAMNAMRHANAAEVTQYEMAA